MRAKNRGPKYQVEALATIFRFFGGGVGTSCVDLYNQTRGIDVSRLQLIQSLTHFQIVPLLPGSAHPLAIYAIVGHGHLVRLL